MKKDHYFWCPLKIIDQSRMILVFFWNDYQFSNQFSTTIIESTSSISCWGREEMLESLLRFIPRQLCYTIESRGLLIQLSTCLQPCPSFSVIQLQVCFQTYTQFCLLLINELGRQLDKWSELRKWLSMMSLSSSLTGEIFLILTIGTIKVFFYFITLLFLQSLVEQMNSRLLDLTFPYLLFEYQFDITLWWLFYSEPSLLSFYQDLYSIIILSFLFFLKQLKIFQKLTSLFLLIQEIMNENLWSLARASMVHNQHISIIAQMIDFYHFYLWSTWRLYCTKLLAKFQLIQALPVFLQLKPIIYFDSQTSQQECQWLPPTSKITAFGLSD